jgi:hypothetical protein
MIGSPYTIIQIGKIVIIIFHSLSFEISNIFMVPGDGQMAGLYVPNYS